VDLDLTGKLALVTGSTRGIGLATVTGLARMGAAVIVNGRTDAAVTEAIARVQAAVPGAVLRGTSADLSDAAGCARLIDAHPEVDILVNNLGIYEIKPFLDTPDADWQRMFAVNVMGGVRLTRHYLARMLATRNWGRVVFVSSESGVRIPAEMVHYGFSKGAQLVIARGAAELTAGTGITVNSVLPGPTWVETQQPRLEGTRPSARDQRRGGQGTHLHGASAHFAAAPVCDGRGSRQPDLLRVLQGSERHQWRGAAGRWGHCHESLLGPRKAYRPHSCPARLPAMRPGPLPPARSTIRAWGRRQTARPAASPAGAMALAEGQSRVGERGLGNGYRGAPKRSRPLLLRNCEPIVRHVR
jgi:NAD(P)-dependent dehydrogenase (short-subunit alcohol dehydrogenase family)